jgi:hypothetical protein
MYFLSLLFYFVLIFPHFHCIIYICSPFHSFVGPKNVVGPRHSVYSTWWVIQACMLKNSTGQNIASMYSMFHLERKAKCYTVSTLRIKTCIEFLQPCSFVLADVLLDIGTAVISAVPLLDEHLSQTNTVCRNLTSLVHCCLIRYFLTRISTDRCFMNSSKGLKYQLLFKNKHLFSLCTCKLL